MCESAGMDEHAWAGKGIKMSKFKVGDKVVRTEPHDKLVVGAVYTVAEAVKFGIRLEGHGEYSYSSCYFEHNKDYKGVKPHKHAELIKAWADGAEIECLVGHNSNPYWVMVPNPAWNSSDEYRVRVQPKPDYFRYARCVDWDKMPLNPGLSIPLSTTFWSVTQAASDNLKATFDGETGKLKAVEILA